MITKICGFNGAGKTELASMIVAGVMLDQIKHGSRVSEKGISELNAGGFKGFETAPHYVFCNWKVTVKYKGKEYHSWDLNPYDIGLFNGIHPIKYFPPGAILFIDESKDAYDKKNFAFFPPFLINYFVTHRHIDLNIFLLSPSADDDDKTIRELIAQVYSIQKNTNKYWFKWLFGERFLRKSIIHFNVYTGKKCIFNACENYQPVTRAGRRYLLKTGQQLLPVYSMVKVFRGNIFKHYCSFSHRWRFYLGATATTKFAYEDKPPIKVDLKTLSRKVFDNSFNAPVTWLKATVKERKDFEKRKIKANPFAKSHYDYLVPVSIPKVKLRFYTDFLKKEKRFYESFSRVV